MAIDTSKNSYTILFSIAMVVVVGAILAGLFGALRGNIATNKKTEKQQNILFAMGITDGSGGMVDAAKAGDLFNEKVKQYVVTGNKAEESSAAFDIDIKKEMDLAKDPSYTRRLPLYVANNGGKNTYIVPMRGNGLWDAIWGYMAIGSDLQTVEGAVFDHKGETPGLGANIKEPFFQDDFKGEKLYAGNTFKGITVAKGNNDPKNEIKDDNEVDAIAGATITGDGVTAMIKKDLKLYLPYFNTLKK